MRSILIFFKRIYSSFIRLFKKQQAATAPYVVILTNVTEKGIANVKVFDDDFENDKDIIRTYGIPGLTYKGYLQDLRTIYPDKRNRQIRKIKISTCSEAQALTEFQMRYFNYQGYDMSRIVVPVSHDRTSPGDSICEFDKRVHSPYNKQLQITLARLEASSSVRIFIYTK